MGGTRGAFVAATLALVAVLTSALAVADDQRASTPTEGAAPGRPNVVVILTDDMRADELRYLPKTRRLLVDQGVRFSNAISPHPMCCPARAELVTGQYGQNNGVRHNTGRWGGAKRLNDPDDNLGRWLQAAGYRTSYHGKFLNGYERLRPRREPAGWTVWDAQVAGIYSYRWARFFNGDRVRHEYVTETMTERTGDAFRRFADGRAPFFTLVNHVAPHVTLSPPFLPRWQRKYDDAYRGVRPPSFGSPSFNAAGRAHVRGRGWDPTARQRVEPDTTFLMDPAGDAAARPVRGPATGGFLDFDAANPARVVPGRYLEAFARGAAASSFRWIPCDGLLGANEFTVEFQARCATDWTAAGTGWIVSIGSPSDAVTIDVSVDSLRATLQHLQNPASPGQYSTFASHQPALGICPAPGGRASR